MLVPLIRQLLPTEYNTPQCLSACGLINGASRVRALSAHPRLYWNFALLREQSNSVPTTFPFRFVRLASHRWKRQLPSIRPFEASLILSDPYARLTDSACICGTDTRRYGNPATVVVACIDEPNTRQVPWERHPFGSVARLVLKDPMRPHSRRSS